MKLSKRIFICVFCLMIIFTSSVFATDKAVCDIELPILLYHNINGNFTDAEKDLHISKENFESHIKILLENGYTPISFSDYYEYRTNKKALPKKPIIISFDDGYLSNYEIAFPLIKKYDIKATIFAVTKSSYNPYSYNFLHFDWDKANVMQKSNYIDIESHSFSHLVHNTIDSAEITKQARKSYYDVSSKLGKTPLVYAYPEGKFTEQSLKIVEDAGYKMQVIVKDGINRDRTPLNQLKRININGKMSDADLMSTLKNCLYLQL